MNENLKGMEEVLANLNRQIAKQIKATETGLKAAAMVVNRDAVKLAPIDTGNLRASAYIRRVEIEGFVGFEVGFGASYAVFVHENPRAGKTKGYSPKGVKYFKGKKLTKKSTGFSQVGEWKFLEKAVFMNTKKILEIVKGYSVI